MTVLAGAALAIVTGGTSLNALRKGYYRGSRRYGGRRIYREKNPRLFWVNIVLMLAFSALGVILAAWAWISPGSFR